ncbi:carbohydrate ABC transporter permease [Aestuariivirga litoralis]|uniref:carbohydrate ABC transporter permease n=1 Tax=Aestuariivirga litoralis TaxID=2650924 RepID=UPI0018C6F95E|nr:carbohydrate ABC transporter permease [Aestuariivirga litoralis]MBG1232177.1 carbohydrate ABC transporter permease [Aestuariivirga litoralis]
MSTAQHIEPQGPRPHGWFEWERFVVYAFLILTSLYFLLPLYIVLITSTKNLEEIAQGNLFVPSLHPTFAPWYRAWFEICTGLECKGIHPNFMNSVIITVPSVIVSIAVAITTGYALNNWPFRFSEGFFTILIIGSFVPYQVMLFPMVLLTKNMGIYSTLYAVIFVHTVFGLPILTLLFRNYFASLPVELFKAARVDGAGFWRILFQVFLPMSVPMLTVAVILQVTGIWNDFLFGVVFAGLQNYPMTVKLNNIFTSTMGVKEYNVEMAATMLTGAVPLLIYFLSGRYFVRGIAAGAVKG